MSSHLMKRIGKSSLSLIGGLVLIGFAFVYACGQIPDAPDAESAVGITAPDGYAISCGTNFIRVQPHFCAYTFTNTIILTKGSCLSFQPSTVWNGVPTTAKALSISIDSTLFSNNVLNQYNTNFVGFYTASGCATTQSSFHFFGAKEFTAIASTVIARNVTNTFVTISSDAVWYLYSTVGGSGHSVSVGLVGYYD